MAQREYDVAAFASLDPAGVHPVEAGGETILLVRDGDEVFAIGAICPHAGAPLAEGVRDGTDVICPWHKAAFCARTGLTRSPPAVDNLPRYETRIASGRVIVRLPAAQTPAPAADRDRRHFVILGAGAAGAVAAQTLRQEGFGGRITMIDRANRVPYDRTVLSKYALSGEKGAEKSPLQTQSYYRAHGIDRRTGDVAGIDAAARTITCTDGAVLHYDAALIATGATPIRPDFPGANLRNVFVLRSREDADAILAQAERSTRAVILGASFIGMEVAASLRERGLDVTVASQERAPFEKQLGARVGGAFVELHQSRGVSFRLGAGITALAGDSAVSHVLLNDGERLAADLVVVGFGVSPATDFAHGLARGDDGGLTVDARLRAADGVFAAGDVARFPIYGNGPAVRVEHWRVAQQHGRVAALNMLGRDVVYDAVPVFWTIQYLKRLDYIGHAGAWDDVVVHGDLQEPKFLAYYVKDGIVRAAAGLGRDRDTAALVALMERRHDWTAEELGDAPAEVLAKRNA